MNSMKLARMTLFGALAVAVGWPAGEAMAGKADDTLNWATDREIAVIDPYYNNTRELVVQGHLGWDGLLYRDLDTGEFKPLLASNYEWKGNLAIEFDLRKDVTFHDGSTFDADDAVYTLNHVANKDNGVLPYTNVAWIKNAEKLGPHKIRINLKKPFPAALAYLSNAVFMMPSGHYDKAPAKADGKKDFGAVKPVGTGPYKFVEVKAGDYVLWA